MQNQIPPQVQQAINFHTNRLGRMFRLQPADRDDVRQELTLKALEAMRCHRPDMKASIETYTKQAICRRAYDLAREIITMPQLECLTQHCYVHAIERAVNFTMNVQSFFRSLTPPQKTICLMLIAGYTQEKIALSIGIRQQNVNKHIRKIRLLYQNYFFYEGVKSTVFQSKTLRRHLSNANQ
jgi:RNA polymerase sigma factor (sigma-70 family)